jgi:hypothetical protein
MTKCITLQVAAKSCTFYGNEHMILLLSLCVNSAPVCLLTRVCFGFVVQVTLSFLVRAIMCRRWNLALRWISLSNLCMVLSPYKSTSLLVKIVGLILHTRYVISSLHHFWFCVEYQWGTAIICCVILQFGAISLDKHLCYIHIYKRTNDHASVFCAI